MRRVLFIALLAAVSYSVGLPAAASPPSLSLLNARAIECRTASDHAGALYDGKKFGIVRSELKPNKSGDPQVDKYMNALRDMVWEKDYDRLDTQMQAFTMCLDFYGKND